MTEREPPAPTLAAFEPHLATEFRVRLLEDEMPPLRLDEATALPAHPGSPRQDPFALVFSGPAPAMEQRTYRLEHPAVGALDVFLVPIAQRADGRVSYEAVFN